MSMESSKDSNITIIAFLKKFGLVPRYTEITLYFIAITWALTIVFHPDLIIKTYQYFFEDTMEKSGEVIFLILLIFGFFLSLYHAFSKRIKNNDEKIVMLAYVICTNLLISYLAAVYIFSQSKDFLIIFPVINFIQALLLFMLLRLQFINKDSITDDNAKKWQIVIGTVSLIIIFLISNFILNNYWALTFSLCLIYSMGINDLIEKFIIRR